MAERYRLIPHTSPEVIAEALDISPETVRRHCRENRIPGAVRVGRSWAIPVESAEQYVINYDRHHPPPVAPGPPPGATGAVPPDSEETETT